ncbi:MAG: Pr6Pr family membrane protein [Acidimicrobiia bacterium]
MSGTTHRALRLALASLLTVALVARLAIGMSRNDLTVAQFFSLFTVLSNLVAIAVLVMLAWRPDRGRGAGFIIFRGAVTVYMAVTGGSYALILVPDVIPAGLSEPWVDWCLLLVGPIAVAIDWALQPPSLPLPAQAVAIWLVFPAVYLVYTLTRGEVLGWYPYPFLDPGRSGYGAIGVWSAVVLTVVLGLGYVARWWANRAGPAVATAR